MAFELDSSPGKKDKSFFETADWFAHYLAYVPRLEEPEVIEIGLKAGDSAKIFLTKNRRKFGVWTGLTFLNWNASSYLTNLGIVVESNNVVSDSEETALIQVEAIKSVLSKQTQWFSLQLDNLREDRAKVYSSTFREQGCHVECVKKDASNWVDLALIRKKYSGNFLSSRSANTRNVLSKNMRAARRSYGDLRVEVCDSRIDLEPTLEDLKQLHRRRWSIGSNSKGGFNQRTFDDFYTELALKLFIQKRLILAKVSAGSALLGLFYLIRTGAKCEFLMGGLNYEVEGINSPGYLAHAALIQWAIDHDLDHYDFLVGAARYKSSLSTHSVNFQSLKVYKAGLNSFIAAACQSMKNK